MTPLISFLWWLQRQLIRAAVLAFLFFTIYVTAAILWSVASRIP